MYCDDGGPKKSEENVCKSSDPTAKEVMESPTKHDKDEDMRGPTSKNEENVEEDSPIMGLLTPTSQTDGPQGIEINKSKIKVAIWERADHIRANSEYGSLVCLLVAFFLCFYFIFWSNFQHWTYPKVFLLHLSF